MFELMETAPAWNRRVNRWKATDRSSRPWLHTAMEFQVLGPLQVIDGGQPLALGGRRQRLVLACLLARANRPVTTATLIDEVWGDDPPDAARNSLQSYVSHLRKALGTDRLVNAPGGYVLEVAPADIDAGRFEALVQQARADPHAAPAEIVATLDAALALWRGPAFADLADERSLAGEIARLEELRLAATETKLGAALAAGRHGALVAELESLTSRHPLRETLWGQLMLALYRSGRQGDALAAYTRARTVLRDELGIDPSPELRELHGRMLRQDPDLNSATPERPSAVATVPAEPLPTPELAQARRESGRRRLAVVGTASAVVLAGLLIAVPRLADGDAAAELRDLEPGMAIIDAVSGALVAHIPTSTVKTPAEAIFAEGHFWVLNLEPLSFVQIEPATGRVVRQISAPTEDVGSYTVADGNLWVTENSQTGLYKVDVELGRVVERFDELPGPGGSGGVIVADGSVWVARRDAGLGILARLDPVTGEVQHLFRDLLGSLALAYGDDGAVWTGGSWGHVNRVDPLTNTVTSGNVGGRNFYIAAGSGHGWTTDDAKGVVHKIDGTGTVVATYPTGLGARVVSYSEGVVWVGNQDVGTVSAIDAGSGDITTYEFEHPIQAVAAGAGTVLVQLVAGRPYEDDVSEIDGEVARFFVGSYELDPTNPELIGGDLWNQVARTTCAGLLRQREDGELQPEVAASMPTVTEQGRTYTFTIRSGYRFSPPSNEAVTAETFRHTIERAASPPLSEITGAARVLRGTTITDVQAAGDALSITIDEASDDFLEQLTDPRFCAVPLDTPAVFGGEASPAGERPGEFTVASAGPYYIAHQLNGEYTILLRNPHYNGPLPHRFDAIVLREGVDADLARDLVEDGQWDGILHLWETEEPIESLISDNIGCRTFSSDSGDLDLAAICRA
jgi:DNA-binding SARP family transcriptional activator/streptogramin lyase